MSELQLKEIADNADMIIANYSFTVMENGDIKILYLSNPDQACVLNKDGAGYVVLFDLTLAIGGKLQENLKEARMMRGIDKSSECDIIEFPESPLENTNVK